MLKILLSAVCLFLIFIVGIWYFGFYEPMPPRHNFIGMTRMEVLDWCDKHGRACNYSFVNKDDKDYNKIEIDAGHWKQFFEDVSEIIKNKETMTAEYWRIGGMSLRLGTRLYYRLKFKNNIVIDQHDAMIRDW